MKDELPSLSDVQRIHGKTVGPFDNCDCAVQWLRKSELPFVQEIERAAERISLGEEAGFQDPEGLAAAFLHERIAQAIEWTEGLSTGSESPIDFPDMPFARFARWLLLDWWEEHGRDLRAEWMYLE